jgi:protein O-GlcNAc transferase
MKNHLRSLIVKVGLSLFLLIPLPMLADDHLQKGSELLQGKKYAEAITELQLALKDDPKNEEVFYQLGLAYTLSEQIPEAKSAYQKALQLKPDMWESHFNLGMIFSRERNPAEALPHLTRAHELTPDNFAPLFFMASCLELTGKKGEAQTAYQAASEKVSDDAEKGECHLALARLALDRNDLPDVEKELEKIRQYPVDPASIAPLELKYHLAAGHKEQALALIKQRLALQPSNPRLLETMAHLQMESSQFAEAALSFQAAAQNETDPTLKRELWITAVQNFQKASQNDLAIKILQQLASGSPDYELHLQLGSLLLHQRRFEEAEKELGVSVKIKPDCAPCWSNLASSLLMQEKYPPALECFGRFAELSPQTAGTYFYMATIYDRYGDAKNAITFYQKFMSLDQGKNDNQNFQARQRVRILENRLKKR